MNIINKKNTTHTDKKQNVMVTLANTYVIPPRNPLERASSEGSAVKGHIRWVKTDADGVASNTLEI